MNKELIINVTPNEIHIALLEDKVLVEYSKERCQTGFSVGDIYLGKVKKIMPGLNAAFVNIGHEKDAFIHYLDLGPQFLSLQKSLAAAAKKQQAQPANAGRNQQRTSQKGTPAGEKGKQPAAAEAAPAGADNPPAGKGQRGRGQKGQQQPQEQQQPAPAEQQAPVTTLKKDGKISQVLTQGQSIMVQIAKEAISTKGPRLTADISLAGRHLVLLPLMNKISISQKIRSNEEKKRLKKMAESVLPKNYGVIIRTAAVGKETEDLQQEIVALVKKWEGAFQKAKHETPPALLASEMNRTNAILRDLLNVSFSSIHVNDEALYEEIKEYIRTIEPEKEKIVKLYKGSTAIFDNFDVTKQIKSSFGRTISFKKGAYIIIEHTEALHVVDVNSGKRAKVADTQEETALEVNINAAKEIARQLRLRDMGGIIVIDFIDMHSGAHRQEIFDKMKEAMALDRAKHTILPLTKFGLMQITRQRVRPETQIETGEVCPTCGGTGEITPSILFEEKLEEMVAMHARDEHHKELVMHLHPFVAAYLEKGLFCTIRGRWARKYKCKIKIIPDLSVGYIDAKFFDRNNEEIQ